jgi:hypothetical protein
MTCEAPKPAKDQTAAFEARAPRERCGAGLAPGVAALGFDVAPASLIGSLATSRVRRA